MDASEPLVSILIPAYNCRPWVARAVESALTQSWNHREVIVVDDCSTDETDEELKPFRGSIRVERSSVRGGQNVTRNRLTELAEGQWLVYLDADDELDQRSVELKLRFSDEADAIYGSTKIAAFEGEREIQSQKIAAEDHNDVWPAAFAWSFPNTSAFCFRRTAVIDAGGWNKNIKNCTDYDLYFRLLLKQYRFKAAPAAWSTYRQWSSTQAVNEDPLRKMSTRLELMFQAAAQLKAVGGMTAARQRALFDASLGVLRTIYPLDTELALEQHERLLAECPACLPSKELFPARYRWFYQTIGFSSAERIAELMRT
jgi:glycosyltransferase involved in cell wall biosynthesis